MAFTLKNIVTTNVAKFGSLEHKLIFKQDSKDRSDNFALCFVFIAFIMQENVDSHEVERARAIIQNHSYIRLCSTFSVTHSTRNYFIKIIADMTYITLINIKVYTSVKYVEFIS